MSDHRGPRPKLPRPRWRLLLTVLLAAACGAGIGYEDRTNPRLDGARELRVQAIEFAYEPDTLEVAAGEAVNLVLVNTGRAFHDLASDELGIHLNVQPGQHAETGLAVAEPGTYRMICTVPGHERQGMVLLLEVTP